MTKGDKIAKSRTAYLGPKYSGAEVEAAGLKGIEKSGDSDVSMAKCNNENELLDEVTDLIASGGVVGWYQGRMEWGPRALGNRSILCDPRRSDMKDILNLKIKKGVLQAICSSDSSRERKRLV